MTVTGHHLPHFSKKVALFKKILKNHETVGNEKLSLAEFFHLFGFAILMEKLALLTAFSVGRAQHKKPPPQVRLHKHVLFQEKA